MVVLLYDLKGSKRVLFDGKWDQKTQAISLPLDLGNGIYTLEVNSMYGRSAQVIAIQ